jgi:hypothetical protein
MRVQVQSNEEEDIELVGTFGAAAAVKDAQVSNDPNAEAAARNETTAQFNSSLPPYVLNESLAVLRPQVTVIEQGPLINGRLDLQLIEGARMLMYQFYGAVNEENAVSVNDLYSCLYDREVNQIEERRSTQINFRQTMLDVEYIRHTVGPSNEIKIWTLIAGTAKKWFRFRDDCRIEPGSEDELQMDHIEENIDAWIRSYSSQFVVAYGREPHGFPYGNARAQRLMRYEDNIFGAPAEGGFMASAPSSDLNTDKPGRWGIMIHNLRCQQMYKSFGQLLDQETGAVMADHTMCHMMEIAVMKLFNHGRRAEIDWGDGLQKVSRILHQDERAPMLSRSSASYCPINRIGYELADILDAHLQAWFSLGDSEREGSPSDKKWCESARYITGKHEIFRVIGKARRMLDLLLESSHDDICYRRSDSLENNYREVRESVDHTSRRDHKLIARPDDMSNLYTWRQIRDSKEGNPATNVSNATASMMGWLCRKTAEAHPNSPVAKLMGSGKMANDEHTHDKGIKIDSKILRQAWVIAYAQSQRLWIDQLKKGMSSPSDWYFRALTAALNSPRSEIMCMNKCVCTDESQPTDEEYQMNDEVPLERKPMDCWWEPIAHTAEDRTRHLHNIS